MRISDWSSDVCSSDLSSWAAADVFVSLSDNIQESFGITPVEAMAAGLPCIVSDWDGYRDTVVDGETGILVPTWVPPAGAGAGIARSEEHTSELQSLMRISYAVFCLKKKTSTHGVEHNSTLH